MEKIVRLEQLVTEFRKAKPSLTLQSLANRFLAEHLSQAKILAHIAQKINKTKRDNIITVMQANFDEEIKEKNIAKILEQAFTVYSETFASRLFEKNKVSVLQQEQSEQVWGKWFQGKTSQQTEALELIRSGCFIRATGQQGYTFSHKSFQEYFDPLISPSIVLKDLVS